MAFDPSTATAESAGFDPTTASLEQPPIKRVIGVEALPKHVKDVVGDFNPLSQAAVGAKAAWDFAALRLKQLAGLDLTPEEETTVRANRALLEESNPAKAGQFVTNVAATAVPMAGAYNLVNAGARAILPNAVAPVIAPTIAAGTTGAAYNALTEPNIGNETTADKMKQGAIGSMIVDAAMRGGARVLQPIAQSPQVQKLLQADVVPTIGQSAGGMVKKAEDALTSLPLVGSFIDSARGRAVSDLNRAAIQQAAPEVRAIGREGITEAHQSLSDQYKAVLNQFTNGIKPDQQFMQAAQSIPKDPTLMLSGEQRKWINKYLYNTISTHTPGNSALTGEMAKKIDSELGAKASSLLRSSQTSEREVGQALQRVQGEFRGLIERNAPTPEVNAALQDLNSRWANLVRVEGAGAKSGASEGVFTAAQLSQAVREADKSVRKNAYARGAARMQDLSDAAKSVLGPGLPNSGTTDRALMATLLASLGGTPAAYMFGMPYLAALASAPLLYSKLASQYAVGATPLIGPLQQSGAAALRQATPYVAPYGGMLMQGDQ